MIIGTGIDVTSVERHKKWLANPSLMERFFAPEECDLIKAKGGAAVMSVAARFAAKEAFGKALGTGLSGISLRDIAVLNQSGGKPVLILKESALEALKKSGGKYVHVSLSHEKDIAAAIVVIES